MLQGDTLAPCFFIICLDYVLRTSIDLIKENDFKLTKARSRRYPAQTITDADYADDTALLTNTFAQTESLLHSLEQAAEGISLHVNADKTVYMCFNQRSNISTLWNKWTSSPTSEDINTQLAKAWTAIDRLSVIWKSDLTDKIKRIFPNSGRVETAIWMHYTDAN